MIKKMNVDMFPAPNTIISTLCRKGTGEANKIFNERLHEIQKLRNAAPIISNEKEGLSEKMVWMILLDHRP